MGIFWALAALVERQSQLRAASAPVQTAPPPRRAPPMVRA
jgi:hypothetical protein